MDAYIVIFLSPTDLAFTWIPILPLSSTDLAFTWIPIYPLSPTDLWLRNIRTLLLCFVNWILSTMPMKRCCACSNTRADNVILHLFPNPNKEPNRFKLWVNAIGGDLFLIKDQTIFDYYRVCHAHFDEKDRTWSRRLSPNAVPTLNLRGFRSIITRTPLQEISNQEYSQPQLPILMARPSTSHAPTAQPSTLMASTAPPSASIATTALPATSTDNTDNIHLPSTSGLSHQHALPSPKLVASLPTRLRRTTSYNREVVALNKKIINLQKSKATLAEKLKKALKLSENTAFQKAIKDFTPAATIFTFLQFREIGKKKLGRRFTKNEKVMALALYKQGPRSYRWLRRFFVLPSPLTLSRMITRAALKPGLNEDLFLQMKSKVDKMKKTDKLCILLFDEVALSPHFDYSKRRDCITGFVDNGENRKRKIADHALVFMIRGIFKNFKQPVAYTFCASTTSAMEIVTQLKSIIRKLKSIGLEVLATVCDQGATNVSAINWLINETKMRYLSTNKEFKYNIFEIDGNEVVPLYDPPHLIKGIRNNLLQADLTAHLNGRNVTAKWDHIVELYKKDAVYDGIRLIPKLTDRHVIPHKISKMKVKCATQIFSRTVAGYLGSLACQGVLPQECEETAAVLKFFDELFDSVNGSFDNFKKRRGKLLLGPVSPRSNHKNIWSNAKKVLSSMSFKKNNGKSVTVPSIKNWLHTIDNLEYLVNVLQTKYKLTSLWMRHFNQDPLENFFGSIRSHGYRNNSPSCASFEAAFASLLINNMSSVHSPGSNCEVDSCSIFKSLKILFFKSSEKSAFTTEVDFEDIECDILKNVDIKRTDPKIRAQLDYVTGYVLRKLKIKCSMCKESLYHKDSSGSAIMVREYFKNKTCLTYPSLKLIKCFSNIQDVVMAILRKKPDINNVMQYIKTILSIVMDYSFIKCCEHQKDLILKIEQISLNLFVYNWCKNTNKLLAGSRTDYDKNDEVQKLALMYCTKRLKK